MDHSPGASARVPVVGEASDGTSVVAASLAQSAGGDLAFALLPLLSLIAALVAAITVVVVLADWFRKPPPDDGHTVTDPTVAGIAAVAFVSGSAAARWLPATVLQLADDGIIAVRDRRGPGPDASERARDVELVLIAGEAIATRGAGEPGDDLVGTIGAVMAPSGSPDPRWFEPDARIEIDRIVHGNPALRTAARAEFRRAADSYREPRPAGRFRTITVAGGIAIVVGIISLLGGLDDGSSVAFSAMGIGALALAFRALLPRWIPLNTAGLRLRERAAALRDGGLDGPGALPWAVLFGDEGAVRRLTTAASTEPPPWYRSREPSSPERIASCVLLIAATLSLPITVGGRRGRDDSRFGVPLVDDHRAWWGGGYLAGGEGYAGGGGFDGPGGFDGGGLDGGGIGGGFDGGGGGGGDGGGG